MLSEAEYFQENQLKKKDQNIKPPKNASKVTNSSCTSKSRQCISKVIKQNEYYIYEFWKQ